jgi:hypothetical protein
MKKTNGVPNGVISLDLTPSFRISYSYSHCIAGSTGIYTEVGDPTICALEHGRVIEEASLTCQ